RLLSSLALGLSIRLVEVISWPTLPFPFKIPCVPVLPARAPARKGRSSQHRRLALLSDLRAEPPRPHEKNCSLEFPHTGPGALFAQLEFQTSAQSRRTARTSRVKPCASFSVMRLCGRPSQSCSTGIPGPSESEPRLRLAFPRIG